jgi:hypothetical protein
MKPNGQTRRARGPEHAADPAERVRGPLESYGRTTRRRRRTTRRRQGSDWQASRGQRCRQDASAARLLGAGAGQVIPRHHGDLAALSTVGGRPSRLTAAPVRLFLTRDLTPHNSTAER